MASPSTASQRFFLILLTVTKNNVENEARGMSFYSITRPTTRAAKSIQPARNQSPHDVSSTRTSPENKANHANI